MAKILVDDISIEVVKKKIKNIYICIIPPDGIVRITAPLKTPDAVLRIFAVSKISWIKHHQKNFQNQVIETPQQYVTGETLYLWGEPYQIVLLETCGKNSIEIDEDSICLKVRSDSTTEQREKIVNEWYRKQLKEAIPELIEKCEKIVGVNIDTWNVKNMRTRWGTCNPAQKRIWLSLQLAKKPMLCLEYVIIHELVHLLERGHNARFKAFMSEFCPDWKNIKKQLNSKIK